ncbi:MAG: fused MFS/spermidine synthase [Myxococcota bacterium]|nr:fused MFS/spermidine synthase [Myxococcota bacterium]
MSSPVPVPSAAVGRGRVALISLFFVSGAASLVYEAVWNRLLVLQMGNTAYALTTILTVFMAGLALGSFVGGRYAARLRDPLRTYGWLELGIGIYCLFVPLLIDALEPLMRFAYNDLFESFVAFSFFQFLGCGAVLILPITAMGATLPIVSDFIARRSEAVSASVGLAYGVNTFGGFVGVMLGGLVLIPAVGLQMSNGIAASLSCGAGIAALLISQRLGAPGSEAETAEEEPDTLAEDSPFPIPLLLLALAASGFASMTYQVAWTRVITLSIGSVTYSFPLIVGGFIGGLAVGAAVIGRLGDRPGMSTLLLVMCQLGIAAVAALSMPWLGDLPVRMALTVLQYSDSFAALQIAKFGAVFAVVFVPTFLMGGMLPLATRAIAARRRDGVGAAVGRAYASNTFGTIVGSFLAGFVLIPAVGMQEAIAVAVAVNAAVGGALVIYSDLYKLPTRILVAVVATAGLSYVGFTSPDWDRAVLTSAPYLHAPLYADRDNPTEQAVRDLLERKADIVYYREDYATTVTVLDDMRVRYLYVGGKLDAISSNSSQSMLGHVPMLLHPDPKQVLVIGLGSSESLAATLQHDSLEAVDCIEISPAVVEAAEQFFQQEQRPIHDPRLNLRIGDGRVHMAMSERKYDVIVSQPGNPWMAGASALFTREFFEQMKAHLAPGGIASVWVQGFSASPESVNALIGTFESVFEDMDLWETRLLGDYILTGYLKPTPIELSAVEERMQSPRVAANLDSQHIYDAADFAGYFVSTGDAASRLPGADRINRDDHNFLELRLQRELLERRESEVLESISSQRLNPLSRVGPGDGSPEAAELRDRLERIAHSKSRVLAAWLADAEERKLDELGDVVGSLAAKRRYEALLEEIKDLNPNDSLVQPD